MKRLLLLSLCVVNLLFSSLALAGNTAPLLDQVIPEGLSAEQVAEAFYDGGDRRNWTVVESSENLFKADIHVRKHYVAVNIKLHEGKYDIVYLDSENMKYQESSGRIHSKYQSWVKNLNSDIQAELRKQARKK